MLSEYPKISIIVPVYNAQEYLENCIKSLLEQTYDNYEILLINDGSTDGSRAICNYYEIKYDKISVFNQKNSGVSCARNKGLEFATGQYAMFVDADDWINNNMLSDLVKQIMNSDSDLVMCSFIREHGVESEYISSGYFSPTLLHESEIEEQLIVGLIEKSENENSHCLATFRGPVAKLFNLELIRNKKLYFDQQLIIGEDFLFNLQYLIYCKKVLILNDYYYHYRVNEKSISRKYKDRCWSDIYMVTLQKLEEFLLESDYMNIAHNQFYQLVMKYYALCLDNEMKSENPYNIFQKIKNLKVICCSAYVREAIKIVNVHNCKRFYVNPIIFILTRCKMYKTLYCYLDIKTKIKRLVKKII